MVGSLFSKRPRVTDSNCKTSCFACTFFSGDGFPSLTGIGLACGVIKRGSDLLGIGGCGRVVPIGAGSSIGIVSAGWEVSIAVASGSMSIFGGAS